MFIFDLTIALVRALMWVTKEVKMQKIQCAVYVRKSTEHGLEQEFNSLDNQELACKSYIASQTFQGWEFFKTYSDGGISGGLFLLRSHLPPTFHR